MTPSPYQSKLLRLAIAQYRKGLDRHRQAFRHARSTTVATVEVGTALAMIPIFAMVQVSQMAGRRLKQSVKKSKVFGFGRDSAQLLNFSDFGKASLATSEPAGFAEAVMAERSMVQTLRAVGDCLLLSQLRLLVKLEEKQQPLKTGALVKLTGKIKISVSSQITGVACDLETRSLLLVINYSRVWNGLSADQQRALQRQIGQFLPSVEMIQVADGALISSKKATAISRNRNVLTQPFHSFWVEVLRTVAWMKQRYRARAAARLMSGRSQVEGGDFGLRSLPKVCNPDRDEAAIAKLSASTPVSREAISLSANQGKAGAITLINKGVDEDVKQETQPYYWEADVITVGYIEHPFERFLKWVDRILLWIEGQWQLLMRSLGL